MIDVVYPVVEIGLACVIHCSFNIVARIRILVCLTVVAAIND